MAESRSRDRLLPSDWSVGVQLVQVEQVQRRLQQLRPHLAQVRAVQPGSATSSSLVGRDHREQLTKIITEGALKKHFIFDICQNWRGRGVWSELRKKNHALKLPKKCF